MLLALQLGLLLTRESHMISSILPPMDPFCDVATVTCLRSSTPSFSMNFPLYHTLCQLATAVSDCVAKEGELAALNTSEKLSGGVKPCKNTVVCSVFSPTDS